MVEQHPFKLLVPGSNPGQPTTGEHPFESGKHLRSYHALDVGITEYQKPI
jgi:hypothetical protein